MFHIFTNDGWDYACETAELAKRHVTGLRKMGIACQTVDDCTQEQADKIDDYIRTGASMSRAINRVMYGTGKRA